MRIEPITRNHAFMEDAKPALQDLGALCTMYGLQSFSVTINPAPQIIDGQAVYRADEKALAFAFLSGACAAIAIAAMVAGFLLVFRQEHWGAFSMLALYIASACASGFLFSKSKNGRAQ